MNPYEQYMFVNSGRGTVFMFSGMNKDLYGLRQALASVFVYFCYGYNVPFQQFSLQCHFASSQLDEKGLQATQSLRPSSVQHQPYTKYLLLGNKLTSHYFIKAMKAQLIDKLLVNIKLISFKNIKYPTSMVVDFNY